MGVLSGLAAPVLAKRFEPETEASKGRQPEVCLLIETRRLHRDSGKHQKGQELMEGA